MVDHNGQEHMIMTFFVQGRPDGETVSVSELSYWERTTHWLDNKTSNISFDNSVDWSKDAAKSLLDTTIRAFKYLSGDPLPPHVPPPLNPSEGLNNSKQRENSTWSFAGMFSSIRGPKNSIKEGGLTGRRFTEGEVHADLIKVNAFRRYTSFIQANSCDDAEPGRLLCFPISSG